MACSQLFLKDSNSTPQPSITLTVSAAASLQNAFQDIQAVYKHHQPTTNIVYNFGSSGSLMQQISQGAPVDVFLSASEDWMEALSQENELVEVSRRRLLTNSLVLVASTEKSRIKDWEDLITDKTIKIAVGETESVPVGRYTQEVLKNLKSLEELSPQLVFGKNARQVLAYVETGNAAAGIVYATDALISKRVDVVEKIDSTLHSPIIYPVAVIRGSDRLEAAQTFVDFLSTRVAKEIFERFGFEMAHSS